MPNLDAVLFDLGSTLIYFDHPQPETVYHQADLECANRLIAAGFNIDPEAFSQKMEERQRIYDQERSTTYKEYNIQYAITDILGDWGYAEVPPDVMRIAVDATFAVSQAYWHPEVDAVPTLEVLQKQGYHIGLISNAADEGDVQALIDKAGIRPYLEIILVSATQGVCKPHPQIFHTALNALGVPPQRAVMVGDYLKSDILGAHNAGMPGIWIKRRVKGDHNRPESTLIFPEATIDSLPELPPLLTKLGKS